MRSLARARVSDVGNEPSTERHYHYLTTNVHSLTESRASSPRAKLSSKLEISTASVFCYPPGDNARFASLTRALIWKSDWPLFTSHGSGFRLCVFALDSSMLRDLLLAMLGVRLSLLACATMR